MWRRSVIPWPYPVRTDPGDALLWMHCSDSEVWTPCGWVWRMSVTFRIYLSSLCRWFSVGFGDIDEDACSMQASRQRTFLYLKHWNPMGFDCLHPRTTMTTKFLRSGGLLTQRVTFPNSRLGTKIPYVPGFSITLHCLPYILFTYGVLFCCPGNHSSLQEDLRFDTDTAAFVQLKNYFYRHDEFTKAFLV